MLDTLKPNKISREGVILIKSFEGFRPRAIQRADGRWSIGYGHTQSAREGLTVSESDAELLLQYDLIPVGKAVDAVQAPLNQHQYDALASFAFSVGVDRFGTSDVVARLNAGAPAEAADALIAWGEDNQIDTPQRRRAAERALFVANPDAPVSLADLLAAPLPPPAVTVVESTVATDAEAETVVFDAADVAPFPADPQVEPESAPEPLPQTPVMTREAAVAALLGESHADAAAATEGEAAPEIVTETEASPQPEIEAATEIEPAEVEPAVEISPEAAPPPPEPVQAPVRQNWGGASSAAFYSPYALRAVGPLPGFGAPHPAPVVETTEAEAAGAELVAANDVEQPTANAPEVATVEDVAEVAPSPLAEAETATGPEMIESLDIQPLQYQEPAGFTGLQEQPVQVPVFAPVQPQPKAPTLVLTETPGLQEISTDHRLAWPETNGFAHLDQTPLFDTETEAPQDAELVVRQDPEAPRRLDWSETATFLIMGGIGLVSFGAAMAAFRRAAESNGGDTALIGWVLAIIALACVSVSGYNLYQRWGRADRA